METLQRKIKAFPLYTGTSGCDYHRVKLPFIFAYDYCEDEQYKGFKPTKELILHAISISELLVLNRLMPIGNDVLKQWKDKFGFKLAVDLDDWISLPDYHPNYKQYKKEAGKQIIESLKMADVVTVTTDRLWKRVKEINPNTHVIPNAIPFGHIQFTEQPNTERDDFNFIYTGQSSHLEDVRIMQADIKRASKLPNVSFSLAGYKTGRLSEKIVHGKKISVDLTGMVWNGIEQVFNQGAPYTRIPAQPLHDYMRVYDNADCSLVPLCLNDFNSCKSNLKVLEAACKKIPAIVSYVPPYRDDEDAPVLWVKKPGDWYGYIKYLSEHREVARNMGQELYEWAKEKFDLIKWNKVRFDIYQSILK